METWARRALEIDPRNGRAWATLTFTEYRRNPDPQSLLPGALRAASFAPRDGYCQDVLGIGFIPSTQLSVDAFLVAWRSDPLYLYPPLNAAQNLMWLGRPAEGLSLVAQVLELEPDMVADGRYPQDYYQEDADLLTVGVGDPRERQEVMKRLLRLYAQPGWSSQGLAMILARRGETEAAIGVMTRAANALPYDWLMLCSDLESLRGDGRFTRIAAKARSQFEGMLRIIGEARARGEFPQQLEKPLAHLLDDLHMSYNRAVD